jgi:hypothetical protein
MLLLFPFFFGFPSTNPSPAINTTQHPINDKNDFNDTKHHHEMKRAESDEERKWT